MPNGAGDHTECSPLGCDNYAVVRDIPPDDSTTYVWSLYDFEAVDDYNLADWPGSVSDVIRLLQGVEVKKDATVRFKAPKVTIKSGVNAHECSTVSIQQ